MHERLHGYPVVIDIPVAWGDMDAFQHVNNIVYFRYFEDVRVAYFTRIGFFPSAQAGSVGVILASIGCAYKFPLTYPDTLWAAARITSMAEDRLAMHHRVVSQRHGRVAAEGEGMLVAYDYRAQRRAPLPEQMRQAIAALQNGS